MIAPSSATIKVPRVTPIPIPTCSAVVRPVVEVLTALGAEIIEDVGDRGGNVRAVGSETADVELCEVESVCDVETGPDEMREGVVDPVCKVGCVLDVAALAVDVAAADVPLCTAEHTLKAFCLAVATASTPVQRPSRIPKLMQAPESTPRVSPEVLVVEHKQSRVGVDEHLLSGNCCSTEDFKHGCAHAGRNEDTSDGRVTE